jgi:hypothetical protein
MYQANPELSPFDIRNIMQETATYRECHYMAANEPCPEDLLPKNRQNNVYGHGHVNALESVLEAAQKSNFNFNKNISLEVQNSVNSDNQVLINDKDAIVVSITEKVDTIQWRSNHLRDDWSTLHSYDHTLSADIDHETIVHKIEHLPGVELVGNHTVSIRALKNTTSSPLVTVDISLGPEITENTEDDESSGALAATAGVAIIVIIGFVIAGIVREKLQAYTS